MAEFASIPCFEQTGLSDKQNVQSAIFDVAPFGQVVAAFKVVAIGGTTQLVDAYLQHSMDMDQWDTLVLFTQASAAGLEIVNATKFARYLRAVVNTNAGSTDMTVTFSLLAIAREIG